MENKDEREGRREKEDQESEKNRPQARIQIEDRVDT